MSFSLDCRRLENLKGMRRQDAGAARLCVCRIGADWLCVCRMLVLEEAMGDLGQMIRSHKKTLSLALVRRWSRDLIEGLAYLHSIRCPPLARAHDIYTPLTPSGPRTLSSLCVRTHGL